MKKALILILNLILISTLTLFGVACSGGIKYTDELVIDEEMFRGKNGDVEDYVLIWVDVEEGRYDASFEYGYCLYDTAYSFNPKSKDLNKLDDVGDSFGIGMNAGLLRKGIKWGLKAYVKDGNEIRYSETTAYFET